MATDLGPVRATQIIDSNILFRFLGVQYIYILVIRTNVETSTIDRVHQLRTGD